jgi:GNAT superfamily N-acetyltransferase
MGERWEWAAEMRERHFAPPLDGRYRLERVDGETYWNRHESELRRFFGPEAHFDADALAGDSRRAARERLAWAEGADRLAEFWLVHAGDGSLAGTVAVRQRDADTFELHHVTLHPDHRGRGLYRELLARVLAYAAELGFATTVSEHSPSNNAVVIQHLKAGFRIVGLEVNPLYGPAVKLAYFHDPHLQQAYEYRCGLAVMDASLHAAGSGAFALLDEQFAAASQTVQRAVSRVR